MNALLCLALLLQTPTLDESLIKLSDDSYQVREQAQKDIINMGRGISKEIRRLQKEELDPEVKWRLYMIAQSHHDLIKPVDMNWPAIDCLPKDYPARFQVLTFYCPTYEKIDLYWYNSDEEKYHIDFSPLENATRRFIYDLQDAELPDEDIVLILWEMYEIQYRWDLKGNRHYKYGNPELAVPKEEKEEVEVIPPLMED